MSLWDAFESNRVTTPSRGGAICRRAGLRNLGRQRRRARAEQFTPSSRAYRWNTVRRSPPGTLARSCQPPLRGWFMTNRLDMMSEDVAVALGLEVGEI
jgi:hypothetical protein